MHSDRLFAGPDFHSVLEHYKTKLVQAYEQLLDEEALDEQVQKNLKAQFSLDVPVLRSQAEIWAEESTVKIDVRRLPNRLPGFGDRPIMEEVPEFTVHVPFDGDPDVFNISPSIYSVSPASGKIIGQELLLKFLMAMPGLDLQGSLDRTLGQINSALGHLREQMVVFGQGLDIAVSQAVMLRKQRMQMRSSAVHNLKIPVRTTQPRKPLRPVPESESPSSKMEQTKSQMWDVFISHASRIRHMLRRCIGHL